MHPSALIIEDSAGYTQRHPDHFPTIVSAPPAYFIPRYFSHPVIDEAEPVDISPFSTPPATPQSRAQAVSLVSLHVTGWQTSIIGSASKLNKMQKSYVVFQGRSVGVFTGPYK